MSDVTVTAPQTTGSALPAPYRLGTHGGSRPLTAIAVVDGSSIFAISAGRPYRLQADGSLGAEMRPERPIGPAVAIGAGDGLVAIVSAYPVALAIFRGDGSELAGLPAAGLPGISHPAGVAIGGERLAISCTDNGTVSVFDLATLALTAVIASPGADGVGLDPQGRVWVADAARGVVIRFEPNGVEGRVLGGFRSPGAPAFHGGRIAVPDADAGVVMVGGHGPEERLHPLSGEPLSAPRGTAFLPGGRLLVCQETLPSLLRFDPA